MAAVIPDIFGYLVEGLSKVNNAAVSVPSVDEIIYDAVLVAFTNQIIKDNNFLQLHKLTRMTSSQLAC